MNLTEPIHATTVVEHDFAASPARVFAACSDPALRRQWDLPGDDSWELAEMVLEPRVGGREYSRFGPKGDARYWSEGRFLDVVSDLRLVSAGTMHAGDTRITSTLCTIQLVPRGTGTHLVLTDQSVFLTDLEKPSDRRQGWTEIAAKLARFLQQ